MRKDLVNLTIRNSLVDTILKKHLFCETCVLGNSKRVKFSTSTHSIYNILNYVHLDPWRLGRTRIMGGARYFMTLVDDCSTKVWLYLLKSKDETVTTFKKFKVLVQNQIGRKLRNSELIMDWNTAQVNSISCVKHRVLLDTKH